MVARQLKKAPATPPPPPRRRVWLVRGGIAAAVLAVGLIFWRVVVTRGSASTALPSPPTAERTDHGRVVFTDFLGAEACAECHVEKYAAWKSSTHGRAGGLPTRDRVLGPFDGRTLRFRDAIVTPSVGANGTFKFTVAQRGRPAREYQVHAVVGGGFMVGGGTQAYFSKFPDGTLRFLPWDYSVTERLYFCNTLGRANRGWLPITPDLALADCGDWPPERVLGSTESFQTCQQCHGSQIEVAFDSSARLFETRFTTLGINCESCHGPGRRHIELVRSGRSGESTEIGMRALATLTKDQSLDVCFQCHAAKTALEPSFLPGKPLERHFALKLPILLDSIYFADGRTRSFAYQEGHLASDCYLNGSMTCVDCHEPHSQAYRDVNGVPLPGRFSDGQCTGCHASKADSIEQHTKHPATSAGSRCVACHMPYLQQPNVGTRIRYGRSDHAIPIPRPVYDTRLGVETACQQCHRNRTPEQLGAQVESWYGKLKPLLPVVEGVLAADSLRDVVAAARAILSPVARQPIADATGLALLLQRYAAPFGSTLDEETVAGLQRMAQSRDLDVQALALATLHLGRGTDPAVRRFLARQVRGLGDRDQLVRDRWAWVLMVRGDDYLARNDHRSALAAYERATELKEQDPALLRRLGVAQMRLRDFDAAIDHFRRSLALRDDPRVRVEFGFALMQRGDVDGAEREYRRAIELNPQDAGGYANLAIVQLRRGSAAPAIETAKRALELEPGLAEGYFLLAQAFGSLGQRDSAEAAVRRGLEFDPQSRMGRSMLEALERH